MERTGERVIRNSKAQFSRNARPLNNHFLILYLRSQTPK
ncbi:hypothetical protein M595_2428 [Lyngbya aestuarii BL J]|uniref:Uncharacterized protein n=1 Tax=Lyngbya aestuarii BL J TaxID=1348334 RepID=U7QJY2_9CYAN|nr:hypothetical protein M595_2428 [Lyngbya aestuarii BL J]